MKSILHLYFCETYEFVFQAHVYNAHTSCILAQLYHQVLLFICILQAIKLDSNCNGSLIYSIDSTENFFIDPDDGRLYTSRTFTSAGDEPFSLIVTASLGNLTSTAAVNVNH